MLLENNRICLQKPHHYTEHSHSPILYNNCTQYDCDNIYMLLFYALEMSMFRSNKAKHASVLL